MERNEKLLLCPYWFSSLLFDSFRRLIHLLSRLNTRHHQSAWKEIAISRLRFHKTRHLLLFSSTYGFSSPTLFIFSIFYFHFIFCYPVFSLLCVWDRRPHTPPPPPPSQKSQNDSIRVYQDGCINYLCECSYAHCSRKARGRIFIGTCRIFQPKLPHELCHHTN